MFTFAWPYAFLALPLLWIVLRLFPLSEKSSEAMLRVPFIARITELAPHKDTIKLHHNIIRHLLAILAWLLLIIACANPQWLGESLPIKKEGRNIMLAVDLSPSMQVPDLNQSTNRLDTVKQVAAAFIDKRHGDKLGLILFGSKAYLQTPLTFDRKTVRNMLDDASIGLAGQSTAIGDAIGLAVKKLGTENIKSRILILLTDGANNSGTIDPVEAADLAKDNQIKIYTIGLGATKMVVSGFFGPQVVNPSADLDEGLLKTVADTTGGQYFRAHDDKTLTSILDAINKLEPVSKDVKTARPVTALFYWPLAAALLLLVFLFLPSFNRKLRV